MVGCGAGVVGEPKSQRPTPLLLPCAVSLSLSDFIMKFAPLPADESERLADLRALEILDSPPEERFDRLVRLTGELLQVPIAYLALIDSDRQWFKARCGISARETRRDISFCSHTILHTEPLVVPDARLDPRFCDNPLVLGDPHIRFYAGVPLAGPDGFHVGTLCAAGPQPRELTNRELRLLQELAELAERELQLVDLIAVQRQMLEIRRALTEAQRHLAGELEQAASYVRSLLPTRVTDPNCGIQSDWVFLSSSDLGGDLFGYHQLSGPDGRWAMFLLDVMGHGIGACLLSVSIYNTLRNGNLIGASPESPAEVLAALNRAFPMEEHDDRFFTIWYGAYDPATRHLRYASAGHHPAVLFDPGQAQDQSSAFPLVGGENAAIGMLADEDFGETAIVVPPGGRVYLFSDGVFEARDPTGALLGYEKFVEVLQEICTRPGLSDKPVGRVQAVLQTIQQQLQIGDFQDDFSLLEVSFPD